MALFWPEQKVALDIVDDEFAGHISPGDLPEDWDVLRVTQAQASTPEGMRQVGDRLCEMMGIDPPEKTPEWLEANERLFNALHPGSPGALNGHASNGALLRR